MYPSSCTRAVNKKLDYPSQQCLLLFFIPFPTIVIRCRNSTLINISIENRYYNRFIHLERPIFPVNHNGTSLFTIPTTFGIVHGGVRVLHSRGTSHPICDLSQIIATRQLDAFTLPSTHYISNNYIYFQSHLFAATNSISIDLITLKDWFLFSIDHQPQATTNPAISSCLLLWLPVIVQWL